MTLTKEIIMPGVDYQAICDAVRDKTGSTEMLKSGDIAPAIASISSADVSDYLAMINGTDVPEAGGTLTFPADVTRIPNSLYSNVLSATPNIKVVVHSGITEICNNAFDTIGNFASGAGTTFQFGENVETIGEYAFSGARYCKFIGIPSSVKQIGLRAFQQSQTLTGKYSDDLRFPNIVSLGKEAFASFGFAGENVYLGPNVKSIESDALAFAGGPAFTLTIDKPEDSISGAPWGATNATIVWTGGA